MQESTKGETLKGYYHRMEEDEMKAENKQFSNN